MKIGDKIKALRLTQGNIKISDMAAAINIPESKISSYERNLSRPPHQILLKIAEFFKVPAEFFFEDMKDNSEKEEDVSKISKKKDFEEINIIKSKITTDSSAGTKKKNADLDSVTDNNKYFQILHNDLIGIKTLLTKLIEVESNKPNFNNIKNVVRVTKVHEANKYLKQGYVLLELYKDDKGQLGFTLGGD